MRGERRAAERRSGGAASGEGKEKRPFKRGRLGPRVGQRRRRRERGKGEGQGGEGRGRTGGERGCRTDDSDDAGVIGFCFTRSCCVSCNQVRARVSWLGCIIVPW